MSSIPNQNAQKFRLMLNKYMRLENDAPRIIGRIAVNFFKNSFRIQGQKINGTVRPWAARGASPERRKGRKLLIDEGNLQRGIIVESANKKKVVIGVDAIVKDYAKMMNDGAEIAVTIQMRKFFWAMYFQASGGITYSIKSRKADNTERNKSLSKDAMFWRNMALTKRKTIKIPSRKFMYDSPDLVDEISRDLMVRIDKIINIK